MQSQMFKDIKTAQAITQKKKGKDTKVAEKKAVATGKGAVKAEEAKVPRQKKNRSDRRKDLRKERRRDIKKRVKEEKVKLQQEVAVDSTMKEE